MAHRRVHFVDVPPPDVIWLAAGTRAGGAVPQAPAGAKVEAGAVVAGIEHTSTVAVTPLAGEVGRVAPIVDSAGRRRWAVPVLVADDAESQPVRESPPADIGLLGRDDLPAWIDRLERAGVRAERHNSPSLIDQLLAAMRRPIDSIICHAIETDPTLPVQAQWAMRHPLELRDGLRLLARLTGARRTILAVAEGDNRRLYRHLRRTFRRESSGRISGAAPEALPAEVISPIDIGEGESVMLPLEAPAAAGDGSDKRQARDEPGLDGPSAAPSRDARATGAGPGPGGAAMEASGGDTEAALRSRPIGYRSSPPQSLGLRLIPVRNAYPQADPTLLVWALLSRRLPPGRLPVEAGALVLDAVAATAVGAVARGASVIRREPIAVRDHRREVSILADVWRGSSAQDVLRMLGLMGEEASGGDPAGGAPPGEDAGNVSSSRRRSIPTGAERVGTRPEAALRAGDYLRENALPLESILDGGELVLHVTGPVPLPVVPEPCIRCGWCLDICPTHVHPAGVLEAAQRSDAVMGERFGVGACIECGLCSYVCPSRLPLLGAAREMKRSG